MKGTLNQVDDFCKSDSSSTIGGFRERYYLHKDNLAARKTGRHLTNKRACLLISQEKDKALGLEHVRRARGGRLKAYLGSPPTLLTGRSSLAAVIGG